MSTISFAELYRSYSSTKEADNTGEETAETEPVAEAPVETEDAKEAEVPEAEDSSEEIVKTAAEWLEEVSPELAKLAEKVGAVIDGEDNQNLFGQCLDAIVLFKTAGMFQDGYGNDARSLVRMANELYRTVRDVG